MALRILMVSHGTTSTTATDPDNLLSILQTFDLNMGKAKYRAYKHSRDPDGHYFVYPGMATADSNLFQVSRKNSTTRFFWGGYTLLERVNRGIARIMPKSDLDLKVAKAKMGVWSDRLAHGLGLLQADWAMKWTVDGMYKELCEIVEDYGNAGSPVELTLVGWSRGAVACGRLMQKINAEQRMPGGTKFDRSYNLFLIDPCNGLLGLKNLEPPEDESARIDSSVEVIMMEKDLNYPADHFIGPGKLSRWIVLPGTHSTALKYDASCKYGNFFPMLRHELTYFLSQAGIGVRVRPQREGYTLQQYWKFRLKRIRETGSVESVKVDRPRVTHVYNELHSRLGEVGGRYFVNSHHAYLMGKLYFNLKRAMSSPSGTYNVGAFANDCRRMSVSEKLYFEPVMKAFAKGGDGVATAALTYL